MESISSGINRDIEHIVNAAVLAPSGDNCQPWHFIWDGEKIGIKFLPIQAEAFLDTQNVASWMALGATLTNMHIAAQEIGFKLELELFPTHTGENMVALLRLQPIQSLNHPLYSFLKHRCTNRRPYLSSPLPPKVRSELIHTANTIPGVSLDLIEDKSAVAHIAKSTALFDRQFFRNKQIHDCLYRRIRWTPEESNKTRDGLPLGSLELNSFDSWGLRWAGPWARAQLITKLGFSGHGARRAESVYRRSAAMGLLTIDGIEAEDFVLGGMVFQRLWLTVTQRGLSLQPVTGMMYLDLKYRFDRAALSKQEIVQIEKTRREIQLTFPNFVAKTPVMMFRLGTAEAPTARALRRPVSDMLTMTTPQEVQR